MGQRSPSIEIQSSNSRPLLILLNISSFEMESNEKDLHEQGTLLHFPYP